MNKKTIKEYRAWKAMKARCNAPSAKKGTYLNIDVCISWKDSYQNFLNDMGNAPSTEYSLDRINNSKGYCKENCRWTTQSEQCKNRGSFNNIFTYDGKSMVLKDWAKHFEISYSTLHQRIFRSNLSFEDAITYSNLYEYNGINDTLKNICKSFSKVKYQTVVNRLHSGWNLDKALTTPHKTNMI